VGVKTSEPTHRFAADEERQRPRQQHSGEKHEPRCRAAEVCFSRNNATTQTSPTPSESIRLPTLAAHALRGRVGVVSQWSRLAVFSWRRPTGGATRLGVCARPPALYCPWEESWAWGWRSVLRDTLEQLNSLIALAGEAGRQWGGE